MDRISNNLLALLLVFTMMISALGTSMALLKIDSVRHTGTGRLAGVVGICLSNAPIITPIGDQNITQNQEFFLDVDDTQTNHGAEVVLFWDNVSFFEINKTTGILNITATNAMVGENWVLIWANESLCGLADSELINFTVHNVNDAPVLDFIPDQTLYEDVLFEYDVNATDPDMLTPYGETITFGENSSLFEINTSSGLVSFIPVQAEADQNYSILFYVFDDEYVDTQTVIFEIISVNDAPVLDFIGAQTAIENTPYYYDVNATDEEGDPITFYENATIFDIDPATGVISFTPNTSLINNYSINISVTDGNGWDTEIVSFTVVDQNDPPNITQWYPNEENVSSAKELGNKTTSVWYYTDTEINFRVNATDPDGTDPSFWWVVDNETITGEVYDNYTYITLQSDTYLVEVFATDGLLNDTHKWNLIILNRPIYVPPDEGGGGGGGGGWFTCFENWRCTEWSTCTKEGIQTRTCVDLEDCGTFIRKPPENRSCFYSPFPSCFDDVKNCHDGQCEIMTDCGGPCDPCPTCDDGIRNQGEKGLDCGGPCPPCADTCIQVTTRAVNMETGECRAFSSPCDLPEGWKVVDECPPIQPVFILLYIMILALVATVAALVWVQRVKFRAVMAYYFSRIKNMRSERKVELTEQQQLGKETLDKIKHIGGMRSILGKPRASEAKEAQLKRQQPSKPQGPPKTRLRVYPHKDPAKAEGSKEAPAGGMFAKETLDEIKRIETKAKEERLKNKKQKRGDSNS